MQAAFLFAALFLAQTPADAIRVKDAFGQCETLIELKAETMGKAVRWRAVDPGLNLLTELPDMKAAKTAYAIACRPGRYKVEFWTSIGDEPSAICFCYVTCTVPNPSPPNPGPNPLPPDPPAPMPVPPNDPLFAKLQAAYTGDPGALPVKKAQIGLMIGLFQAMVDHAKNKKITVVGDLLSDYRETAKALLVPGSLVEFRKVIAAEVANTFGLEETAAIDDGMRAKAVALFDKLAKTLEAVK